jgi:hypothetical protein
MALLPNTATGHILLPPSNTLFNGDTQESAFAQTQAAQCWSVGIRTRDSASYTLRGTWSLEGSDVSMTLWFAKGRLSSVTIFPHSVATDWDTWPEQESLQQRDNLDRILSLAYGSERRFSWGGVSANYDPRSGSASISIRYG